MIRFIVRLLVFGLGLLAAVLWFGEMRHLRQAALGPLPIWTMFIDDRAKLNGGTAKINMPDGPQISIEWQAQMPNAEGLKWHLIASGDGLLLQADVLVPLWPKAAILRNGKGTVSLDELSLGSLTGLVPISKIKGIIPLIHRSKQAAGFVEITFAQSTQLSQAVQQKLERLGSLSDKTLRIPIKLP